MTKIAFFDIDGVLSIPQYRINNKIKPGGSPEWWKNFCDSNENPYKDCKIPKLVYNKLKTLKEIGVKLYVLTTENIPSAKKAKHLFIENNYSDFFDENHIIMVSNDKEKIDTLMLQITKSIKNEEIYYLDDTFNLVLNASSLGFDAHHISEFLDAK